MLHQLAHLADAVEEAADPDQGLDVAQTALSLLDVGLEQEAGIAQLLVPLVALGELGLDEVGRVPGHDLLLVGGQELLVERQGTPDQAGLEECGPHAEVGLGELDALRHRAHGVADGEPEVEQLVEQELRHLLDMRRALVGVEDEQVDVGSRCQLAAPVAADGDHGHLLARGRVGGAVEPALGEVEGAADQEVHLPGEVAEHGLRTPALLELGPDARPPLEEDAAHPLAHLGRAARRVVPGLGRLKGKARLGDGLRPEGDGHGRGATWKVDRPSSS